MKKYIIALVCMLTALVAAAQATVTGVVYEPTGDTAIGASVYEKGKEGKGAVTDIDGNFSLKVSSLQATIVVSYVGLETQEIALNGRSNVEVHMKEGSNALTELVVVGYGT